MRLCISSTNVSFFLLPSPASFFIFLFLLPSSFSCFLIPSSSSSSFSFFLKDESGAWLCVPEKKDTVIVPEVADVDEATWRASLATGVECDACDVHGKCLNGLIMYINGV